MLKIHDLTAEVHDGRDQHRDFDAIEGFMVHRVGVDLQMKTDIGYEPVAICGAFTGKRPEFKAVAKATGGQNAYTIMVGGDLGPAEHDGKLWQCLPLDEIGHHARRFSVPWMGIGLIADPRYKKISSAQHASLVDLLVELCIGWAKDPFQAVKGHGEVPTAHGGEKAPGKPAWCPGFDMDPIRAEVAALIRERGRRRLAEMGLVFQK